MNIKDLNLEDLVLYVDKEEGIETPCKINSLNSNGEWAAQILNSEFIFQGDNNECSVEKCLLPIPLTPEILEKNGFVYADLPFENFYEGYGLHIHGGNYADGHSNWYIICGINVSMNVTHVHELQHALKLCGIDKEIIL